MRGKLLFVAGLATGYVLGTRAGRERYEQIKKGWLKVWNTAPVQNQVDKVQGFAKARISEVPQALFTGAKKVVKAMSSDGTPGEKLDATIAGVKDTAEDLNDVSENAQKASSGAKPGKSK